VSIAAAPRALAPPAPLASPVTVAITSPAAAAAPASFPLGVAPSAVAPLLTLGLVSRHVRLDDLLAVAGRPFGGDLVAER
jgi:hypothetical protein